MRLRKHIDLIEENDLLDLVANKVPEGKYLEYKESLPGETPEERKEFLADVSSFANAAGGHLILGIREENNEPSDLCGVEVENLDRLIQRFENMLRDGIDPRIPGVLIRGIPTEAGLFAIVIHTPRSYAQPHMVTFRGHSRFYSRNSAGKYQLDVSELRSAFLLSETTAERMRNFRLERLGKVVSGEAPVAMEEVAKIVLHIIPYGAMAPATVFDVASIESDLRLLQPLSAPSWDHRYNFDGFLNYAQFPNASCPHSYALFFRNASIEAVDAFLLGDKENNNNIPSLAFEKKLIEIIRTYVEIESRIGVETPILVMLSLLGIRGYKMGVEVSRDWIFNRPIDRDTLIVPPCILETYEQDIAHAIKPAFDAIWNASGWPQSIYYDDSGKWVGKK